jgi:hypothetical protein
LNPVEQMPAKAVGGNRNLSADGGFARRDSKGTAVAFRWR